MDGVAGVGWERAGGFEGEAAMAGAGDLEALWGGVDEVKGFAGEVIAGAGDLEALWVGVDEAGFAGEEAGPAMEKNEEIN